MLACNTVQDDAKQTPCHQVDNLHGSFSLSLSLVYVADVPDEIIPGSGHLTHKCNIYYTDFNK